MKCKLSDLQIILTQIMLICGIANNSIREKLLQHDMIAQEEVVQLYQILETSKQRNEDTQRQLKVK